MFEIALPLALAFIMFSLGISLTPADFRFALRRPRPLLAGILSQVVLLPLIAWMLVRLFGIDGALAVGVMVLACCPGGITSNVMTRLARGDVALSISYTALSSLLTMVSLPLIVAVAARALIGVGNVSVDVSGLSLKMFLMSSLPVLLGVMLRRLRPGLALRLEHPMDHLSTLLFGFQNGTVGIAVGALLAGAAADGGLTAFSLPSGVYGVLMTVTIVPYLLWRRSLAPVPVRLVAAPQKS